MELFFIWDEQAGIYYIKDDQPFFYAFHDRRAAEQFCAQHKHTVVQEKQMHDDTDNAYLLGSFYEQGYKGGFMDGVFRPLNMTNPDLFRMLPSHSALLHLVMYQRSGDFMHIRDERFYFFVQVTADGYLAFANTNGSIFAFTDVNNIDTQLAAQLHQMGYEVIRYYMSEECKYFINPRKPTAALISSAGA